VPTPDLLVVDARRFAALGNRALAAMSRHNMTSIEVAVASIFSSRLLGEGRVAKTASVAQPEAAPLGTFWNDAEWAALSLALDDSDLVWMREWASSAAQPS
jgi:hypothetical protein